MKRKIRCFDSLGNKDLNQKDRDLEKGIRKLKEEMDSYKPFIECIQKWERYRCK